MAKITREAIQKINSKCSNDWKLDVQYFLFHNEKTLVKHIKLDDEHYLEFSLYFNYKNQIQLHISKFYYKQGDTFASSTGLGKHKILNDVPAIRKNINDLIALTESLTNDELMRINNTTEVTKSNGLFLESEAF